jgi:protein-disulfide isomerase
MTMVPARRRRAPSFATALATFALGVLFAGPAPAQAQDSLSEADKEVLEETIRNYILEHPEIIVEAIEKLRQQEQARAAQRQTDVLQSRSEELRYDPGTPVIGNPDGDVVIVEFFDYRCPYCKRVAEPLRQVVKEDGNIRLVMQEYPILSEESVMAAKAALAAFEQGRYEDFHFNLMTGPGELNEDKVFGVAEELGLDLEKLRADMESPEIAAKLERANALGQALNVRGTPAFVIGDEIVPGAISIEDMRGKVREAREKTG